MNPAELYRRFSESVRSDPELSAELKSIEGNEAEIAARFSEDLEFGTAGLRGIIGAGTARMNVYTVSRATLGLFDVIQAGVTGVPSFVVGYDTRIKSDLFARRTAEVLASCGARVYLADRPIPVPLVSYAVRALGAHAGVCITASHNPAAYNGYKVFDRTGSQLLEEQARAVSRAAKAHDLFESPAGGKGEIMPISSSVFESYFASLLARCPSRERSLSVVYTPLCGTGLEFVSRVLKDAGFSDVHLVEEQARHDGNFPTCEKPNPEVAASLRGALELSEKSGADLFLATDPDCDRVGVGVRTDAGYRLLTGNETGVLLMDYLLRKAKEAGRLTPQSLVCTTIVSAEMADAIAADYGVRLCRVLTGFKYIGEQIGKLEAEGRVGDFLFGFEESYGCLASAEVRDKDACEASLLICCMAADYKRAGKTLADALADLEARYSVYVSDLMNFEFSDGASAQKSRRVLASLRLNPPCKIGTSRVVEVSDYLAGTVCRAGGAAEALSLPKSDVLSFFCEGGERIVLRPSGTEPKIKVYLFAHAPTGEAARAKLCALRAYAEELFR